MTEKTTNYMPPPSWFRRRNPVHEKEVGECLYWTTVTLDASGYGSFNIHVRDPYVHTSLMGSRMPAVAEHAQGIFVAPSKVTVSGSSRGRLVLVYQGMPLLAVQGDRPSPGVPLALSPMPGTRARIPIEHGSIEGIIEDGELHAELTVEIRCLVFERI